MSTDTLRELSRKWAAGDIDRETYRRQRRELIDAIVNGTRPLVPYQAPEPPQPTVFPYDDDDGDTTQEIIAPVVAAATRAHAARAQRRTRLLLPGGLLAIAAALLAWWWPDGSPPPAAPRAA
ncbi:MAG: hypothetical protein RLW62_05035, partial [Gammaproteobacteria bacterium]